jgi:hypothetical protein
MTSIFDQLKPAPGSIFDRLTPAPTTPTSPGSLFDKLAPNPAIFDRLAPAGTWDPNAWTKAKPTVMSGGVVSDVFDVLQAGSYGVAGVGRTVAQRIKAKPQPQGGMEGAIEDLYRKQTGTTAPPPAPMPKATLAQSFKEGISHRTSWREVLAEGGMSEKSAVVVGTALDITLDPGWVVTPLQVVGLLGKPLKTVYSALKGMRATKPLTDAADAFLKTAAEGLAGIGFRTTEETRKLHELRQTTKLGLQPLRNEWADFVEESRKLPAAEREVVGDLIDIGAPKKDPTRATAAAGARVGMRVRPQDRENLGHIIALDSLADQATVRFVNKKEGSIATRVFNLADLRDTAGRPLGSPSKLGAGIPPVVVNESGRVRSSPAHVSTARQAILESAAGKGMDARRIQNITDKAIELDDKLGRLLVTTGEMSEETFQAWQGGHLRRAYLMYENPQEYVDALALVDPKKAMVLQSAIDRLEFVIPGYKPARGAKVVFPRQDLDEAARMALGEVKDVSYRMGRQGAITLQAVEKKQLFGAVAEHFGKNVSSVAEATAMGMRQFADDSKAWGALAGKAVPKAIFDDLNYMASNPTAFQRVSTSLVGAWKLGKVVFNPATWVRNMASNFLLADAIAGLPITRMDVWADGLRDIFTRSDLWKEARNGTLIFDSTFTQHELGSILTSFQRASSPTEGYRAVAKTIADGVKAGAMKAADGYQFLEQWGKMSVYRWAKMQGMSVAEAGKLAQKALFDYGDVPRWVKDLRSGRGLGGVFGAVPFVTFSMKAVPALAEAAMKNPARIARWGKTMAGVERLSGTSEEIAKDRKSLPEYIRSSNWLRLPVKDKAGNFLWLDMTYILPMSDLNEASGIIGTGGQPGLMTFPLIDAIQDLVRNQSRFTGRPIAGPGLTSDERRNAFVTYIVDFLAPPILSRNLRNMEAAWKGIPTWDGREQSLNAAVAAAFAGIKTRSFNMPRECVNRIQEIQRKIGDTKTHLRSIVADPRKTEAEKAKVYEDALKQIRAYVEAMEDLTGP